MSQKSAQIINIITYIAMFANFVAGVVMVNPIIAIILFVIIHAVVRMAYLKTTNEPQQADNPVQNPPNGLRMVAVLVTAVIMTNVLFWLGYAIGYGFNMVTG